MLTTVTTDTKCPLRPVSEGVSEGVSEWVSDGASESGDREHYCPLMMFVDCFRWGKVRSRHWLVAVTRSGVTSLAPFHQIHFTLRLGQMSMLPVDGFHFRRGSHQAGDDEVQAMYKCHGNGNAECCSAATRSCSNIIATRGASITNVFKVKDSVKVIQTNMSMFIYIYMSRISLPSCAVWMP